MIDSLSTVCTREIFSSVFDPGLIDFCALRICYHGIASVAIGGGVVIATANFANVIKFPQERNSFVGSGCKRHS